MCNRENNLKNMMMTMIYDAFIRLTSESYTALRFSDILERR